VADPDEQDWLERRNRVLDAHDRGDESYLIAALVDPDHRGLAADGLGELGSEAAVEPLLRLLAASDPQVRVSAARALGKIGSEEALPRLRELAVDDEDATARMWAIGALADIGDPDGVELILPMLLDRSWRVRYTAALALGELGDPRAAEPLRAARKRLRHNPWEWYLSRRIYDDAIEAVSGTRTT
jgi:HEAT repeat protein